MTGSRLLSKLLRFKGFRLSAGGLRGELLCHRLIRMVVVVSAAVEDRPHNALSASVATFRFAGGRLASLPSSGDSVSYPRSVVEEIPWAERFSRVTYRFEYAMLRYCQTDAEAAAELLRISASVGSPSPIHTS